MKKIVSRVMMLTLVSVMLFGLVGCGDDTDNQPPVDTPPVEDVTPTPDNTPTPDVTDPVETPDVNEGDEVVEVEVTMQNVVDTLRNTYGMLYLPSMELDAETFNMMVGIDSTTAADYYSEFYAAVPMMGTHVDKLFVVKTDDTAKMEQVFTDYMNTQIEDTMQYPINVTKLENYVLTVQDDYVVLFMLGGYTNEMVEDDGTMTPEQLDEAQKNIEVAYYTEMNQVGTDALTALFETGVVPEVTSPIVEQIVNVEITEGDTVDEVVIETIEGTVDETVEVVDDTTDENSEESVDTTTDDTPAEGSNTGDFD